MKFEKLLLITGVTDDVLLQDDLLKTVKSRLNTQEEKNAFLLIKQLGIRPSNMEGESYVDKVVNYLTDSFHKDEAFIKKYEPKTIVERMEFFQELSNNIFSRDNDFYIKLYIAGLFEVEVPLFKYIPWKEGSPEAKHLTMLVIERENNE